MKRSLPSMTVGALLVVALGLYMIAYQVRFNEVAVIRTFGQIQAPDPAHNDPGDVITEPGLYWKWPWPIQQVTRYDNRIQIATTTGEETPTRDGKNVIVTTTIGWRIDEPYTFTIKCDGMEDAAEKLKTRVRNDQKTVIGRYAFGNFVSTNPDELRYDQIEDEILATVKSAARELYGIRIESISIEKLALPQKITSTVFEAMKKERAAVAQRYTSEGESEATKIKSTAEGIADTILAFADLKAAEIVADGQQKALEYNKTFSQDEALAVFLLEIENLPKILKDKATVILDRSPFDLLGHSPLKGSQPKPQAEGKDGGRQGQPDMSVALPEMLKPK